MEADNDNIIHFPSRSRCPCEPVYVNVPESLLNDVIQQARELDILKEFSLFERIFCWPYKRGK